MPSVFGRLPFRLAKSRAPGDTSLDEPEVVDRLVDPDSALVGPPRLLPAMIVRQVLFDPSELPPTWIPTRPASKPVAHVEIAKTKRASRPRTTPSPKTASTPAAPKRSRASTAKRAGGA